MHIATLAFDSGSKLYAFDGIPFRKVYNIEETATLQDTLASSSTLQSDQKQVGFFVSIHAPCFTTLPFLHRFLESVSIWQSTAYAIIFVLAPSSTELSNCICWECGCFWDTNAVFSILAHRCHLAMQYRRMSDSVLFSRVDWQRVEGDGVRNSRAISQGTFISCWRKKGIESRAVKI